MKKLMITMTAMLCAAAMNAKTLVAYYSYTNNCLLYTSFTGSCPRNGNMRRGKHHFCHRTLFSRRKHRDGS